MGQGANVQTKHICDDDAQEIFEDKDGIGRLTDAGAKQFMKW